MLKLSGAQIARVQSGNKGCLVATVTHQVHNQLLVKVALLCTSVFRHVLRQEEQVPSCLWPGVEAGALHRRCAGVPCDVGQPAVCRQPQVHCHHPGSERRWSLPGASNHQGSALCPSALGHACDVTP